MWYTVGHASTIICPHALARRARGAGGGTALGVRLHRAACPDAARQCRRAIHHRDCPQPSLKRSDHTQRHPYLPSARPGRASTQIIPAADYPGGLHGSAARTPPRSFAPKSAHLRQAEQRLDAPTSRRGQLRPRHYLAPGQRRNHPHRPHATRRLREASQALDQQPRSRLRQEKKRRDWLIRLAVGHPTWALGFADEVWWSRLTQPDLHTWSEADQAVRWQELAVVKDDPDPKALACYGLLVRRRPLQADQMLLRFVDGRPVSAITSDFLAWCSTKLAAQGISGLLLIWDNASWHKSQAVRTWIRTHNRTVKRTGQGVRIVVCLLPSQRPWLNPIEPKWVHGKRAVVEPDRLLSAQELE